MTPNPTATLASLARTIDIERAAMDALAAGLTGALGLTLARTVELIHGLKGRLVITGIGKSGHVGRKITATLASTGTPAFFVHAGEASHGDLGMITSDDAVIAISASGESAELASIIAYTRRFAVPLIAMTTAAGSTLGHAADIVLELPRVAEACPHGLAPTSSTLLQLATGDALAIALLEVRGFSAQDFRVFHPGGKLGASLKKVSDIMLQGERMPLIGIGASMQEAILVMTAKRLGCVGIVDGDGLLAGIITDGDLRRHLGPAILTEPVDTVMTRRPKVIAPDALLPQAIELLNTASITSIFAVAEGRPVGVIHLHDLLRVGVA